MMSRSRSAGDTNVPVFNLTRNSARVSSGNGFSQVGLTTASALTHDNIRSQAISTGNSYSHTVVLSKLESVEVEWESESERGIASAKNDERL